MAEAAGKIDARRRPEKRICAISRPVTFATMIAWDEEWERIRKHRKMRKKEFHDRRVPCGPLKAGGPARSRCLLECVSNLAANEMYRRGHGRSGEWRDGTDPGRNQDAQKKNGFSGDRDK